MKGLPPHLRKSLKPSSKVLPKALEEAIAARSEVKQHKYGAKAETCLYGHKHASRKECMWCVKLHELQKEGKIQRLETQSCFSLDIGVSHICNHIVDFYYSESGCGLMIENVLEVKGMPTPEWKLKRKMFMALYPHIRYVVV